MIDKPLEYWYQIVKNRDLKGLDKILSENAVFYSPIVHTPQQGKEITKMYLTAAFYVFFNESFTYVNKLTKGNRAVLEFEVNIDDILVNGVDMIQWDEQGQIIEFKVMVRPLKAIQLIHQKMAEMLKT